jgi:hypothetical protein
LLAIEEAELVGIVLISSADLLYIGVFVYMELIKEDISLYCI